MDGKNSFRNFLFCFMSKQMVTKTIRGDDNCIKVFVKNGLIWILKRSWFHSSRVLNPRAFYTIKMVFQVYVDGGEMIHSLINNNNKNEVVRGREKESRRRL